MECRHPCADVIPIICEEHKDISWLDCGKLRYHAFSNELSLRIDSASLTSDP